MDKFEKILNDKLQNFEVPVSDADWTKFEQKFNKTNLKPNTGWKNYLVGGIAAVSIGVGVWYLASSNNNSDNNKEVNNKVVANNSNTSNFNNGTNKSTNLTIENKKSESNNTSTENITVNDKQVNLNTNNIVANNTNSINNTISNNNTANHNNQNNNINHNNTVVNTNHQNNNGVLTVETVEINDVKIEIPKPEFTITEETVCEGATVKCKAVNLKSAYKANWYVNGEMISEGATLLFEATKPGTQEITLKFIGTDKSNYNSETKNIRVLEKPNVDIVMNKTTEFAIPTYEFSYNANDVKSFSWNLGDGYNSSDKNPIHTYKKKGNYAIRLQITGANGCQQISTERLIIENDYNLLAPNAFSPNASGVNDVFIPEALKVMNDVKFTMTIYDKSGKMIFKTNRVDNAWDGTNMNTGAKCLTDAYVWRVELINANGVKEEYIGSVTLLNN